MWMKPVDSYKYHMAGHAVSMQMYVGTYYNADTSVKEKWAR